jgi:hypothetical protein
MKSLLALLLVTLAFTNARAQNQTRLVLYGDREGTQCAVFGSPNGTVDIYMFLVGARDESAVGFYAPTPNCWEGTVWVGDVLNDAFLHIGTTHDTNTGLAMALIGPCPHWNSPVYLGKMSFVASGTSPCCYYEVLPEAVDGMIATVHCQSLEKQSIPYEGVVVDPDETCACDHHSESPTTSEPTTWGKVKALYQ